MEQTIVGGNTQERNRLCDLVNRLTDEELGLPLGNGWTIAAALAHIAFGDQRALVLLRKWRKNGVTALLPLDIDVLNDSMLPIFLAIPARVAGNLATASAEEIDREIERLSPDLAAEIEKNAADFRFRRSVHRKVHLDKIESILNKL